MSSGTDRSAVQADAPHRSVATEVILRNLFQALEKRHAGLTEEVVAAVNAELATLEPSNTGEEEFIEVMKSAAQSVLGKPLI